MLSWRIAFPGNQLCSFRKLFPHLDMSAGEVGMINGCHWTVPSKKWTRGSDLGAPLQKEVGSAPNPGHTGWGQWPGPFLRLFCQYIELLWQPEDLQFIGKAERDKTLSHGCHYSGMGATNTWQPLLLQLVSFHAWRKKMHKRLICIVNLLVKYVCVLHFRWVKTLTSPPLKINIS